MLIEVKVPQLSESVAEATLQKWHKKAGDAVKRDENLVDIETDKVVLETPAPEAGVIVKIIKGDGGTVTSNEVIAQIDTEAAVATATAAKGAEKTKAPVASPSAKGSRPCLRRKGSPLKKTWTRQRCPAPVAAAA
jgi:2-oxoglutarate dehydrogenase E2 component (dihydrolipoamide succinyltransferase)